MKPVILITLYRRYYELAKNLGRLHELKTEFAEPPEFVLMWAGPEVGRLWFVKSLLNRGWIQHVLTRPLFDCEKNNCVSTTFPESHNLRQGLNFIKETYGDGHYVIGMASDIEPRPGVLANVDKHMQEAGAVVFHWQNGSCQQEIWHTNFFAVALDERYWPPVSSEGDADVLERQWGRRLSELQPPNVIKTHNYNQKNFLHTHESEEREAWPLIPEKEGVFAPLYVNGYLPWHERLMNGVRKLRFWR